MYRYVQTRATAIEVARSGQNVSGWRWARATGRGNNAYFFWDSLLELK